MATPPEDPPESVAELEAPDRDRLQPAARRARIACPACIEPAPQTEVLVRWGVRIVRCNGCGLVFANPQPASQDLDAYYDPEYFRRNASKFLELPMRRDVRRRFERYLGEVRAHARGTRLLDAGCGTGLFLTVAREAGYDVHGIELSDFAAAIGREQLQLDIRTGRIEELAERASYDALTMWDFLEHTSDPLAVLRAAHGLLERDGRLFLTVPNVGSWWARAMGSRWVGFDKASEHLFYFTAASLRRLLERAGFTPLSVKPHSWVCTTEFVVSRGKRAWPGAARLFDGTSELLGLRERVVYFPSVNLLAVAARR